MLGLIIVALGLWAKGPLQKWLGVTELESRIGWVEDHLSATEDTIYSYIYDHHPPELANARRVVERGEGEIKLSSILTAKSFQKFLQLTDGVFDETDKDILKKAWARLNQASTRTFHFAAAKGTENTISYVLECITPENTTLRDPIEFKVKINGITLRSEEWEGTHDLSDYLRKKQVVATHSEHQFYKQVL